MHTHFYSPEINGFVCVECSAAAGEPYAADDCEHGQLDDAMTEAQYR